MRYKRSKTIELGKQAFTITIYNEGEGLEDLAKEAGIALKTLKGYRSSYINQVIEPKPTKEELHAYEAYKERMFQTRYQNSQNKNDNELTQLKESFEVFIETSNNPSALIDLAFKRNVNPEEIRTEAFNYAKKYAHGEKLELFKVINKNRSESLQKDKIDFSIIEKLLNFKSNKVIDYLNLIIDNKVDPKHLLTKIDLYLKYNPELVRSINKLTLIKKHLEVNQEYIKNKINENNSKEYISSTGTISKVKTIEVLTKFCINPTLDIDYLINEHALNPKTFVKVLSTLNKGTDKEKLLYNEYQNYLEEEYRKTGILIKTIYNYLENGIEKHGQLSSFNALDYWRIINEKPDKFLKKARQCLRRNLISRIELTKIQNFTDKIISNNRLCTEEELLSLYCAYNGICLDNDTEKHQIINYLKNQNIPLYQSLYYLAFEEYIRGELILNSENLNK